MQNTKRIILLLFSFICFISSLQAQRIIQIDKKFQHKGQDYNYQDMGHIFSQHEGANKYYLKANKKLKTAKTMGIICLISIGFSGLLILNGVSQEDAGSLITPIVIIGPLITIPTGIFALNARAKGKRNKESSIYIFNQGYGTKLPEKNPIEFSLVVKNGLCLQLKF